MTRLPLALALVLAPAIGHAQDAPAPPNPSAEGQGGASTRLFQPPAGCTAFLTVQSRGCQVSHYFTCESDPEGWQRRVDMDEGGVTYFGAIDAETQWMESTHVLVGSRETLMPGAADPASFAGLVATGRDSFDFSTLSDVYGETRFVGEDRLTGETATIDGVTLDRTRFRVTAYDANGVEVYRTEGSEFISRDFTMFLGGTSSTTAGGETEADDRTPVEFIQPGEPGYLSASPKHECGAMMSKASR